MPSVTIGGSFHPEERVGSILRQCPLRNIFCLSSCISRHPPSIPRSEMVISWTNFSIGYAFVACAALLVIAVTCVESKRPILKTLTIAALMLCIFDEVAESRHVWRFPSTSGIYFLDVPIENVLIILGAVASSLLVLVLFGGHLHASDRRSKRQARR